MNSSEHTASPPEPRQPGSAAPKGSRFVRIAAFWKRTARDGSVFWTGPWGSAQLFIFQGRADDENAPDLVLHLAAREQRPGSKPAREPGAEALG